jgi:predicted HD phosphohydrolase
MQIDREIFLSTLGGEERAFALSDEARAEALDGYLIEQLNGPEYSARLAELRRTPRGEPTIRRGTGAIFGDGHRPPVELPPMPERPTLLDFFRLRSTLPIVRHLLQSAEDARRTDAPEEQILACLLHDLGQALMKTDHGWWCAQMVEPYVPERVAFAIRYHQALRFFPDESVGYTYPELYVQIFGKEYVPEPYIHEAYAYARNHPWYLDARMVTVHDLYAFDPNAKVELDPFVEIIERHFRQPPEGLGFDGSPVAHMWRTMIFPDHPLERSTGRARPVGSDPRSRACVSWGLHPATFWTIPRT